MLMTFMSDNIVGKGSGQPKFQFCQNVGKGRHVYVRVGGNVANAWLPYTNILWGNFKGP